MTNSMTLLVDLSNRAEPAWSAKVDRWYQLDEVGYAFCEALHQWNYLKDFAKPEVVILALSGASNLADFDFVNTGAMSPAKFVYTLPNICGSVILQMIGYHGKVYCFHKGAQTFTFAEQEARELAQRGKSVWLFSSSAELENPQQRQIHFQNFSQIF